MTPVTDINTRLKTGDILVMVFCSVMVAISYVYFWQGGVASVAVVRNHLNETVHIDLLREQQHNVNGLLGVSTLEVKQGRVRFSDSPCSNKICVQSGWHQISGAITACLPNRISVQLARHDGETDYDAIIF